MLKIVQVEIGSNLAQWEKTLSIRNRKGLQKIGEHIAEGIMVPMFKPHMYTGGTVESIGWHIEDAGGDSMTLHVGTVNHTARGIGGRDPSYYANMLEYGTAPHPTYGFGEEAQARLTAYAAHIGANPFYLMKGIKMKGTKGKHYLPRIEAQISSYMSSRAFDVVRSAYQDASEFM